LYSCFVTAGLTTSPNQFATANAVVARIAVAASATATRAIRRRFGDRRAADRSSRGSEVMRSKSSAPSTEAASGTGFSRRR
jgi:hypothetical protein